MTQPQGGPSKYQANHHVVLVVALTLLIALVAVSCTLRDSPRDRSATGVSYAMVAPRLGVVVDADMKVVDLDAGGVAEKAGVQHGDVLIALDDVSFASDPDKVKKTMVDKRDAAMGRETNAGDAMPQMPQDGTPPATDIYAFPVPPQGVQQESLPQVTVPQEAIQQETATQDIALKMKLKLKRQGQEIEIQVDLWSREYGFPKGTPTPLMPDQGLFYF